MSEQRTTVWHLFNHLHGQANLALEELNGLRRSKKTAIPRTPILVRSSTGDSVHRGIKKSILYASLKGEDGESYNLLGVQTLLGKTTLPLTIEGARQPKANFSIKVDRSCEASSPYSLEPKHFMIVGLDGVTNSNGADELLEDVGYNRLDSDVLAQRTEMPTSQFDRLVTVGRLIAERISIVNAITEDIKAGEPLDSHLERLGYSVTPTVNPNHRQTVRPL